MHTTVEKQTLCGLFGDPLIRQTRVEDLGLTPRHRGQDNSVLVVALAPNADNLTTCAICHLFMLVGADVRYRVRRLSPDSWDSNLIFNLAFGASFDVACSRVLELVNRILATFTPNQLFIALTSIKWPPNCGTAVYAYKYLAPVIDLVKYGGRRVWSKPSTRALAQKIRVNLQKGIAFVGPFKVHLGRSACSTLTAVLRIKKHQNKEEHNEEV